MYGLRLQYSKVIFSGLFPGLRQKRIANSSRNPNSFTGGEEGDIQLDSGLHIP